MKGFEKSFKNRTTCVAKCRNPIQIWYAKDDFPLLPLCRVHYMQMMNAPEEVMEKINVESKRCE